jgi:hypothetical protein
MKRKLTEEPAAYLKGLPEGIQKEYFSTLEKSHANLAAF